MTSLRIGLVGCGRLAEVGYVPALAASSGMVLAAVADPDPARRGLVADLARAASGADPARHRDGAALVAAGDVDAVVIASPAEVHRADAEAAAAAGIPALVEKPPAPDAVGASALAALDPSPFIAFNRRFDPGAAAVRAALPPEAPVTLDLEIHYRRASWGAVSVADDAVGDLGPHLVDWARWLLDAEVCEVRTASLAHERASITLDLGRGRTARLHAATDAPHRERIEARDPSGALLARHRLGGLVAGVTGRLRPGPHPLVASLAAQLQAFAAAVAGRPAPDLGTAADGAACMAVIDAARDCADAGVATSVSLAAQE